MNRSSTGQASLILMGVMLVFGVSSGVLFVLSKFTSGIAPRLVYLAAAPVFLLFPVLALLEESIEERIEQFHQRDLGFVVWVAVASSFIIYSLWAGVYWGYFGITGAWGISEPPILILAVPFVWVLYSFYNDLPQESETKTG